MLGINPHTLYLEVIPSSDFSAFLVNRTQRIKPLCLREVFPCICIRKILSCLFKFPSSSLFLVYFLVQTLACFGFFFPSLFFSFLCGSFASASCVLFPAQDNGDGDQICPNKQQHLLLTACCISSHPVIKRVQKRYERGKKIQLGRKQQRLLAIIASTLLIC